MMLSTGHLATLANLAHKKAGETVGWVSIAEARELSEMGLAARTRSGWEITAGGEAALDQRSGGVRPAHLAQLLTFPMADHTAHR